jgi:hypothetical protein
MTQKKDNVSAADADTIETPLATDTGANASAESTPQVAASSDTKDAQIAALQAQLAAAQAGAALSQMQAAQAPAPAASFLAPSAPLIGKYDSMTGLVQNLPQKLWDQLSPEDMERFSDVAEPVAKPKDL